LLIAVAKADPKGSALVFLLVAFGRVSVLRS